MRRNVARAVSFSNPNSDPMTKDDLEGLEHQGECVICNESMVGEVNPDLGIPVPCYSSREMRRERGTGFEHGAHYQCARRWTLTSNADHCALCRLPFWNPGTFSPDSGMRVLEYLDENGALVQATVGGGEPPAPAYVPSPFPTAEEQFNLGVERVGLQNAGLSTTEVTTQLDSMRLMSNAVQSFTWYWNRYMVPLIEAEEDLNRRDPYYGGLQYGTTMPVKTDGDTPHSGREVVQMIWDVTKAATTIRFGLDFDPTRMVTKELLFWEHMIRNARNNDERISFFYSHFLETLIWGINDYFPAFRTEREHVDFIDTLYNFMPTLYAEREDYEPETVDRNCREFIRRQMDGYQSPY